MLDATADIAEPRVKKTPGVAPAVVPSQDAQEAIRKAFPYEGDLRVRHLWSARGIARYRANWYRQVEGGIRIVKSLFLGITKTADGIVVQDETVEAAGHSRMRATRTP